jgi:DNA recombination-dependent growth factor C
VGALSGSLSYSRFFVEGELPPDFKTLYTQAVQQRAFEPLEAESDDEERLGWCNIEHPLDMEFDQTKLFYNEYLNIALRVDKWRIPGGILKAYCTEYERKYLAKNNKEKLGRNEKEDIKAVVTRDLKNKLLPSMKTIDVSWNYHTGVVRFWNQSANTCEVFMELFEKTFEVRLVPDNPYIGALQYEMDDQNTERLAEIEVTVFHEEA